MDSVSIVVLTYNRFDVLKQNLSNILQQDYENLEIIISDDCSKDETSTILDYFDDKRLKYIKSSTNSGSFISNCKFALENVTSKYVLFLSDDDYYINNSFISKGIKKLNETNANLVFAKFDTKDDLGNISVGGDIFEKEIYDNDELLSNWDKYLLNFNFATFIFRTELLKQNDIFNVNFAKFATNDYFVLFKIIYFSPKIVHLKEIVYRWHKVVSGTHSIPSSNLNDIVLSNFTFSFNLKDFLHKNNLQSKYSNILTKYNRYAFDTSCVHYYLTKIDEIFVNLLNSKKLDNKEIYIYGSGEVGLFLQDFLSQHNIEIKSFIDDSRQDIHTITFDKFLSTEKKDYIVIVSSFKYKLALKLIQKCMDNGIKALNLIDGQFCQD